MWNIMCCPMNWCSLVILGNFWYFKHVDIRLRGDTKYHGCHYSLNQEGEGNWHICNYVWWSRLSEIKITIGIRNCNRNSFTCNFVLTHALANLSKQQIVFYIFLGVKKTPLQIAQGSKQANNQQPTKKC